MAVPLAVLLLVGVLGEVDVLRGRYQRGKRRVDKQNGYEPTLLPARIVRPEGLDLHLGPRRGQGLGGDDEDEALGLGEPSLKLTAPTESRLEVGLVEEDPSRKMVALEAGLEIALEAFHPITVAVGVGEKDGVALLSRRHRGLPQAYLEQGPRASR